MQVINTDILEQLFGIANGIAEKLKCMPNIVISSGSGFDMIWENFEIVQNGVKINPLTLELPAQESISQDKMEAYKIYIQDWQAKLN